MTPYLWILAGPNGSGKSTLVASGIFDRLLATPEHPQTLARVNPDAILLKLRESDPNAGPLDAASAADAEIDRGIEAGRSLLVETVLSTDKFVSRIERAKANRYRVGLVYVLLGNPELNVARVAQRVAMGGHDVPEDRIRARWVRSMRMLPKVAALADMVSVWDNSFTVRPPRLLIELTATARYVSDWAEEVIEVETTPADLRAALNALIALP